MKSWIEIKADSDFSLDNIPFGIGLIPGSGKCICTRIGDTVVDLGGNGKAWLLRSSWI